MITLKYEIYKMQQTNDHNKKSRLIDIENKLVITSGGGQYRSEGEGGTNFRYKIGSRLYCTTWGI